MKRNGFALQTALWLVAALSTVAAAALAEMRVESRASMNRIALMRTEWARAACAEILLARNTNGGHVVGVDSTDLGRGTWCRAVVDDAAGRVDLNRAPREMIVTLLGSDSLADALLDWRDRDDVPRVHGAEAEWYHAQGRRTPRNGPLASVEELRLIRGFDSARMTAVRSLLAVRGPGLIDLNAAPAAVLTAVPGLGAEAVSLLLRLREAGRRIRNTDELLDQLSEPAREAVLDRYQDFTRYAGFSPPSTILQIEGRVAETALASLARVTVVLLPDRLAVIRQEVE